MTARSISRMAVSILALASSYSALALHPPPSTCRTVASRSASVAFGRVSSSRASPSRRSLSTTVRASPAKPAHRRGWPGASPSIVPRRRTPLEPSRHPTSVAARPPSPSRSLACAARVRVAVAGVARRGPSPIPPPHALHGRLSTHPGLVSSARPRLPRPSHPLHNWHTFGGIGEAVHPGQPLAPCRVAQPAMLVWHSAARARLQFSSCAPRTPRALPCRAVITIDTRRLSTAILSTGSSSLLSSFSHLTPSFTMAAYDSLSEGCPRRPMKVASTGSL